MLCESCLGLFFIVSYTSGARLEAVGAVANTAAEGAFPGEEAPQWVERDHFCHG
jgi:hypothetical protein